MPRGLACNVGLDGVASEALGARDVVAVDEASGSATALEIAGVRNEGNAPGVQSALATRLTRLARRFGPRGAALAPNALLACRAKDTPAGVQLRLAPFDAVAVDLVAPRAVETFGEVLKGVAVRVREQPAIGAVRVAPAGDVAAMGIREAVAIVVEAVTRLFRAHCGQRERRPIGLQPSDFVCWPNGLAPRRRRIVNRSIARRMHRVRARTGLFVAAGAGEENKESEGSCDEQWAAGAEMHLGSLPTRDRLCEE
jgi:hypothetical protein